MFAASARLRDSGRKCLGEVSPRHSLDAGCRFSGDAAVTLDVDCSPFISVALIVLFTYLHSRVISMLAEPMVHRIVTASA